MTIDEIREAHAEQVKMLAEVQERHRRTSVYDFHCVDHYDAVGSCNREAELLRLYDEKCRELEEAKAAPKKVWVLRGEEESWCYGISGHKYIECVCATEEGSDEYCRVNGWRFDVDEYEVQP